MIALYPGAFKPPHRGHFNVVKSLLDGSYNGSTYSIEDYKEKASDIFKGGIKDKPKIEKVIIFVGGGERNGIDKEEATSIWNIYKKHLGNVELVDGQKNPMFAAKDYARENPNEEFVAVTGIRGQEDFVDLKRVTTFNNVDNVQGLALASKPGSGVRATDFRNNILSRNLDKIVDFFPEELTREEILNILNNLKDKIVAEVLGTNIEKFIDGYFVNEESNEGYSGTPIAHHSVVKSADRQMLVTLYHRIKSQVGTEKVEVQFKDDHIKVFLKDEDQKIGYDYTPYMASILEYMIDQKMNIHPLPEVKIRRDLAESVNFFGRTAYYDPNKNEIVLYVEGRHPKDIMRSFVHEMVHHIQNIEGRLGNVQTSNTNEDDALLKLEKEAYLIGNITFRNWEDNIKNNSNEQ